jgi:hypothetical protein
MRFYTKQRKYYCGIDLHTQGTVEGTFVLNVLGNLYSQPNLPSIMSSTPRTNIPQAWRAPLRSLAVKYNRSSVIPVALLTS